MTICTGTKDIEGSAIENTRKALISEVRRGLVTRPRALSPWMFYDASGTLLFERITTLPEYYPTRTERNILACHADAMIAAGMAGKSLPLRIVELGAGIASKTRLLLEAALRTRVEVQYIPIDVSADALHTARQTLESMFPDIRIEPLVLNYAAQALQLDPFDGTTIALYLGSSIGNFSPDEARAILGSLNRQLTMRDTLMLGVDMVKDISTMVSAYNDKEGVTAAFNLNVLRRLNRDLDADFDLGSYRHRALWNASESRIEMHLESIRSQSVSIAAAELDVDFFKGETLHTENSYKFTDESIGALMEDSGFNIEATWKDKREWCAVVLARPANRLA